MAEKTEIKEKNWWRKYTKEYQEEDLSKEKKPAKKVKPRKIAPRQRKIRTTLKLQDPFTELENMQQRMDRTFRDLLGNGLFGREFFRKPAMPRLMKMGDLIFRKPVAELRETDKEVLVSVELPGAKKDNIKIKVEGLNLIIEANTRSEKESRRKAFMSAVRSYSGYRHIIRLPALVDKTHSKANYEAGILTIVLPKKEPSKGTGDIGIE